MDDFWATRTGRWRVALRRLETPTVVDRLYAVVRRDVEQGSCTRAPNSRPNRASSPNSGCPSRTCARRSNSSNATH